MVLHLQEGDLQARLRNGAWFILKYFPDEVLIMQKFCRSCLEPICEGDTLCPNCGDESLPLQTYGELSIEQKKIVLKNVKVHKSSVLKFVLSFAAVSVLILALLYILRLWLNSPLIPYFYIAPYLFFMVCIGQLSDNAAEMGEFYKAKVYSVGAKQCGTLGLVLWFMLMMYDMLTE